MEMAPCSARRQRGDGDEGAGDHVAPGKDPCPAGGQGIRVHFDQTPGGQVHAVFRGEELQVGLLSDGHDDHITVKGDELFFKIDGSEAALLVKDPGHRLQFNAGYLTGGGEDLLDAPPIHDLNAFLLGFFHLPGQGRHLKGVLQADDGHLGRPLALGGTGHIQRHIAAADDDDPLVLRGQAPGRRPRPSGTRPPRTRPWPRPRVPPGTEIPGSPPLKRPPGNPPG